jgi:hypothetical protein
MLPRFLAFASCYAILALIHLCWTGRSLRLAVLGCAWLFTKYANIRQENKAICPPMPTSSDHPSSPANKKYLSSYFVVSRVPWRYPVQCFIVIKFPYRVVRVITGSQGQEANRLAMPTSSDHPSSPANQKYLSSYFVVPCSMTLPRRVLHSI